MIYLTNSFSLGMLDVIDPTLKVTEADIIRVNALLEKEEWISAIGHESTGIFLSKLLNKEIPVNRIPIKLKEKDIVIVFQILQRLPEGAILNEEQISTIPYKLYIVEVW